MVCDQVNFITEGDSNVSHRILLPWVPGVYQEVELKAIGGCAMSSSDYKWFSSDMAVVSASVSGIVQAKKPGEATIRAVSIFDSLNYDEIVIEVSIPSSMVMLPNFPVETPVGSHLQASVTLKASNGAYFYACDTFMSFIRWKTESESFIVVNATEELFASDKQEAFDLAHSQLGNLDSLHLAPGTHLDIMLHGGPERGGARILNSLKLWKCRMKSFLT